MVNTFCQQCGETLENNTTICPKCGYDNTVDKPVPTNLGENSTAVPNNAPPIAQLKTNRGLLKYILLSLVTFGIYSIVCFSSISTDINIIASRYDGKKTMHFCLLGFIVAPLTLGIGAIVWYHKLSARIGSELQRRGIPYRFGAGSFWLWNVLGLLIVVGPLVYTYKLFKAMNLLAENYNQVG